MRVHPKRPEAEPTLRRYWSFVGGIFLFFLLLYVIVETLHVPLLTDPSSSLTREGVPAALVGVGLLVADAVLPVPSSLVMVAHGALFGALVGTLLSLLGRLGFAMVGFAIGRRGGPLLERVVTPQERARADRLLHRWGVLAIVITRPAPLLAETTTVLAGASNMSWSALIFAAALGSLPEAILYALTGAVAATFNNAAFMFLFILVVAGAVWLVMTRMRPGTEDDATGDPVVP